jgi:flagellar biogenesis protein FliO
MKKFLFFFIFTILHANTILNISYFTLDNRIDILFSLDTPFNGKIKKIDKNHYEITNLSTDKIEQKQFNNGLNIIISPIDKNNIDLKFIYKKSLSIKASITAKGYGLRISLIGLNNDTSFNKINNVQLTQTEQNNTNIYYNYIIVIIILIILIFILIYVKKQMLQKLPKSLQKDNYKILYQKMIDPKNRLIMIEIFNKKYLLLLGDKNNILLDTFSKDFENSNEKSNQNDFKTLFDEELEKDTSNFIKNATKLKGNDEL